MKYEFKTNTIYCGDNIKVLMDFPSESVDLIYIDPPFFTSRNYEVIWGDEQEKRMFNDVWKIGIATYRSFMKKRIKMLWRVLKPTGSFYLHCDYHANAHLRIMCDEIFGKNNFQNEIIWRRQTSKGNAKKLAHNHDIILYYTKSSKHTFNKQYKPFKDSYLKQFSHDDNDGKGKYKSQDISSPNSDGYKYDLGFGEKMSKNGYRWIKETMIRKIKEGRVIIKKGKVPRQKRYLTDLKGNPLDDIWDDIGCIQASSKERLGYPTQKPEKLLERIIDASSNHTDIVLDAFCGCGTTLAVAKRLGRRFIGIDFSHTACTLMAERIDYPFGDIIGMPTTMVEVRKMKPFEFQNWACRRFGGMSNPKKVADGGIDGWKNGMPIEVKQHGVGSPDVKKFITVIQQDAEHNKGYMIGFNFTKGALEDRNWAFETLGVDIEFINVDRLLSVHNNK